MTKGKPWPVDDEKLLRRWYTSGTKDLGVIAFSFEGKYSENAIYQKLLDLGLILKEEEVKKISSSSSTELKLPSKLPSVEETLEKLNAALEVLRTSGLEKSEIIRLKGVIQGCKIYKELFADYVDYCGLEKELFEARRKYEELRKKSKNNEPR